MRTSGEAALDAARQVLEASVSREGVDVMRVAEDFFALSDLVRSDARLRRALTDPARDAEDKRALVRAAFGSSVQEGTREVLDSLVTSHWSDPDDLHDACEVLGIVATMEDALRAGRLDEVESELFQVTDFLAGDRELRNRFSDMAPGTRHDRAVLAQTLFGPHLTVWTMRLVRRAVGRTSHGRLLATLRRFSERAASMQGRRLVTVECAAPMGTAQVERLREILRRRTGSEVTLTVTVTPGLVGGFRLRLGTEAVDSSIRSQVDDLRRAIAG